MNEAERSAELMTELMLTRFAPYCEKALRVFDATVPWQEAGWQEAGLQAGSRRAGSPESQRRQMAGLQEI